MRTVAIINQKGGCGKTTTSINLAACLARLGHKTLLADMDPQGHCGLGLAVPEEQVERTLYEALIEPSDGTPADISQIVWQIATDFDLAPSGIRLAGFEQVFARRPGREDRLKLALDRVRKNYEWCVIDCPPGVGLLTFNALKACDEVIVPVETGYFSLHGLAKMMETLEVMRSRCGSDILIRILPTLYDTRTKLAREVLSELRNRFRQYLMESTVNFNTKLKEAASYGQPITEYDPGSRGYKDFVHLARELMGHELQHIQPAPEPSLSRPAELVQRARQLSQFANAQFSPTRAPTAASPETPKPQPVVAQPPPLPPVVLKPTPVAQVPPPLPPVALKPASRVEVPPPLPPVVLTPAPIIEPIAKPIVEAPIPLAPLPPLQPIMRLTAATWPAATELLQPDRQIPSIAAASRPPLVLQAAPAPKPFEKKTTIQKIEEFYGVKQIGPHVIFAAHFDEAKKVVLAGDFNNWSKQATPMVTGERPGDWRKVLPLPPGRYKYRLIVDGRWVTDPNNNYVEANQFGELDNVIEVAQTAQPSAVAA